MAVMKSSITLLLLLAGALVFATCSSTPVAGPIEGDSPSEAYKRLFQATKSKNTEAIKAEMTAKTIDFGVMAAQKNNKSLEATYENGFTATTMTDNLPNIRDERINGEMGAVEVWNTNEKKWEDLPFMIENGRWKLAIGELWAGTYKSPGKGRDIKEREAANAMATPVIPISPDEKTVMVDPAGNASNSNKAK